MASPEHCPNGHSMRPPNVKVGWVPCDCPPRIEGVRAPTGHLFHLCNTCHWEWRQGGCEVRGEWHNSWPERG